MWRRTVLVLNLLAVIDRTSTQLESNGTETQTTKQCCPCPPGVVEPSAGLGSEAAGNAEAAGAAEAARAAEADDCPCRPRDAESEGAPSVYFSNAVRAAGNVMRQEPEEDVKPLLQPEVDLASSVLETLKAATDEEYRDALKRDAARATVSDVATADDTDVIPEESRKVVTIIVSPQDMESADDVMTEASHVQATRCIDSLLGNPRASFNHRTPVHSRGLEDILNLPLPGGLLHRQHDSNLAASDVHESIAEADNDLNKALSSIRLRADSALFNLDPHKISEDINKILTGQKIGLDAGNNGLSHRVSAQPISTFSDSMQDLSSNKNPECGDGINSFEIDHVGKQSVSDENEADINNGNLDADPSSSNAQEVFTDATENEENSVHKDDSFSKFKYPLLKKNALSQNNLFPLKNLLKLKDVELIPLDINKQIPKSKLNIPNMKIVPHQSNKATENAFDLVKLPKLSDLFRKPSKIKIGREMNKESIDEEMINTDRMKSANIQTIPRKTVFKTEILDAVPSPSEIRQIKLNQDNCLSPKPNLDKLAENESKDIKSSFNSANHELDAEQVIDSVAKTEDNLNIFDTGTIESLESKSSEIIGNNDIAATDNFEILNEDQGLEQGNNNEVLIISQEDFEDISPASVDLSELDRIEERSDHPLKIYEELRKNVVEKINALQISNRNALNNIKHRVEEIPEIADSIEFETEEQSFESPQSRTSPSKNIEDDFKDVSKSTEEVTFEDLQNMSDSILIASEKQTEEVQPKDMTPEINNNIDLQTIEPTEKKIDSEEISESKIDSVLGIDDTDQPQNEELKPETERFEDEGKQSLCPSDIIKTPASKETETGGSKNTDNDLETLASEPVVNSILRPHSKSLFEHLNDLESKLRQNIIVQPSPLINSDDLNIFRTPTLNIPSITDLNTNIPTLDEIRMRVSEILGGLARSAGDEEVSTELDSDDFASNDNPVFSTGASSSAPISIFPSLKPLEDINLDIIQLKPLPLLPGLHPLKSEFPGLNLNTYKAKLSVPKSLDLKPLKLASTLGNNGGLVGATLSVGPEQKVKVENCKERAKPNFNYLSTGQSSPTLADITRSIQNNARNLLNIPEAARGQTLQASNVVENIVENLKSNTEDTIRNVHQTLYPSRLDADLKKNGNNLINSGRSALGALHSAPINNVVDSLRSQTENTLKHVHQTLQSPKIGDLSAVIHKNAQNLLKPPLHSTSNLLKHQLQTSSSIDAALDNLKAQSENTFRNMQQSLSYPLDDLGKSIHKTAKNILKSSAGVSPQNDFLRGTKKAIPQISGVVDNLRFQSESTMKNIQDTLNAPVLSDLTSIQKSAQQMLKSSLRNTNVDLLRSSLQPTVPLNNVVENLKSHTQSTMRNIQNSLSTPTIADIRDTVQNHAHNLLSSPISSTGRNAFEQILQASPPTIDLKPHAEKAVKDIQRTLKATLRNSPIKDLQPLPNPEHVLQMISNHHEDVNDKLFAIQTDLADRLESMHNDVMDPERLRSILSPPSHNHLELFAIPLPNSRINALNSDRLIRPVLKAKQPSLGSQRKESKKFSVPKAAKPKSGATVRKTFKIPPAASAPIPAHIRKPILPRPKKPIFLKPLKTDLFNNNDNDPLPPYPEPRKSYQSTTTRRPFIPKRKPLADNKAKVTFASTTPRPMLSSPVSKRPPFIPTTAKPKVSNNSRFKPKPLVRQPTPWSESRTVSQPIRGYDPLTSASRVSPVTQEATKSNSAMPSTDSTKPNTLPRIKFITSTNRKPILEIKPLIQERSSSQDSKLLSSPSKPTTSLLSKLTGAFKGKQSKPNLSSPSEEQNGRLEMAPAGSESIGKVITIQNPMKENVSYNCKMMCVKVD